MAIGGGGGAGASGDARRDRLATAGRAVLCAALSATLLLKGSTTPIPALLSAFAFGCLALLAALRRPANRHAARSMDAALLIGGGVAIYAGLQSVMIDANPFAHPIWRIAGELIPLDGGAISVNPSATRQSVLGVLTPFLAFAAALAFFPDDASASRLVRYLAILGAAFAAFGLVQVAAFPDSLLLFAKVHYLDSLTSVFVNRNSAGTLLGVASFAALIWLVDVWKDRDANALAMLTGSSEVGMPTIPVRLVLPAFSLALILMALFLTRSRGALLATILSYVVVLPMLVLDLRSLRRDWDGRRVRPKARSALAASLAVLAGLAVVVALFGGLTSARIAQGGLDEGRVCFYGSTWAAFAENWRFGAGLGTFQDIFPMYRRPDCAALGTQVSRAHNFYLEGLAGLGAGFVPVLALVYGLLLRMLLIGYRTRIMRRHVPILGLGAVLMTSAHALVDFSLQIPGVNVYVAALLGAVTTICFRRAGRSERAGRSPAIAR